MPVEKITIKEKLSQFSDYWNPRIVGELNGQHVKLSKFKGEFIWHQHEQEDEMNTGDQENELTRPVLEKI